MFRRFCAGDGRLAGGAAGCLGDDRLAGDASAFAPLGDARFAGDRDARPGDAFSCEPFDLPSVTVALGDFSSVTCSRHASSAFSTSLYFSNAAVALPRSQPSLTRCSTSKTKFVTCAASSWSSSSSPTTSRLPLAGERPRFAGEPELHFAGEAAAALVAFGSGASSSCPSILRAMDSSLKSVSMALAPPLQL